MEKNEKVSLEGAFVATVILMNLHQQKTEVNKAKPAEFAGSIAYTKSRTKNKSNIKK